MMNVSVNMYQRDNAMANLRQIVIAQYNAAPQEIQNLTHQFFNAMDTDRNGRVDYLEFKSFLTSEGFGYYSGKNLFMMLEREGNRGLDFWEVMTLYCIIKSGRPFCFSCDNFLWDVYSTCNQCRGGPYFLCNNCYQIHIQNGHNFQVQPMTGPSMQRSQTSNAIYQPVMRGPTMQRSQTTSNNGTTMYSSGGNFSESSSNYSTSRSASQKDKMSSDKKSSLRKAFKALELAVGVGNLAVSIASCCIM